MATNLQTKWQSTDPVCYSLDKYYWQYCYFRAVLIGDKDFGFRVYNYKGGFYICVQIAVENKENIDSTELDKMPESIDNTEFDKVNEQYTFLLHYAAAGKANPNSWEIQQYSVSCLKLPSLDSLDTIDFDTIANNPDWKSIYEEKSCTMPDANLVWVRLNEYVSGLQNDTAKPHWREKIDSVESEGQRYDMCLIRELKAQDKYDTIVKTDSSTFYINTDYVSYEIADDPDVFYVEQREYYPDGMLKSRKFFLPGVYANESLAVGIYATYDEKGKLTYAEYPEYRVYLLSNITHWLSTEYLLRFLEWRGVIDSKTGKGKPVMKINSNVDPRAPSSGVPRLGIQANWQIQADEDINGSVALLIKNDKGTETIFIFAKNSGMIWDKFDR